MEVDELEANNYDIFLVDQSTAQHIRGVRCSR
jgi:hypothetical protein